MAKYNIQLPEPCSEDWNQMTPMEQGRFCAVCEKQIFDFSTYTKEELIKEVQRKGKLCGRVPTQFIHTIEVEKTKPLGLKLNGLVAAAINLLVLTTATAVQGQEKVKVEQQVKESENIPETEQQHTKQTFGVIRGKVMDEEEQPLAGVDIRGRDYDLRTLTNLNGEFELKIPEGYPTKIKVEFQFIGMKTKILKVKNRTERVEVFMMEEDAMLGEVIIEEKKKRWLFF